MLPLVPRLRRPAATAALAAAALFSCATPALADYSEGFDDTVNFVQYTGPGEQPTVTSTDPASPSSSNAPSVRGTASIGVGATITLFSTSDCSGDPIGSGNAEDFVGVGAPGIPVTVPSDVVTSIYAQSSTQAGGNSDCSATSVSYREDSTAPETTAVVPTDWVQTDPEIELSATDDGSGVSAVHYETGIEPAPITASSPTYDPLHPPKLAHGEQIRVSATDAAGNVETAKLSLSAKVDGIAPETTDDVAAASVGPHAVTLAASDSGSGVSKTYYERGTSPAAPTTASAVYDASAKPVLTAGERIRYFTVDVAGNAEAARSSLSIPVPVLPDPPAGGDTTQPPAGGDTTQPPTGGDSTAPAACQIPGVRLLTAATAGKKVQLTGVASPALAGQQARVLLNGKRAASVKVKPDGLITATVIAPKQAKARSTASYRLVVGPDRSTSARAIDAVKIISTRAAGNAVQITGRVPGVKSAQAITLEPRLACNDALAGAGVQAMTDKSGRFTADVQRTAGSTLVIAVARAGKPTRLLPLILSGS